jgi:hypothetical protein|tara:strand:+ start:5850 stop:6218 length:369 start_codon:yes stop_codon:yes gene_type:complete
MKTFRKYSFGSKGAATTKINALGVDEEGNPTHSHAIVHLGNLVEQEAVLNEEGEVTTEAVLSSTYHIDVLWDGEPVSSWDSSMIWCAPMGVHTFGSSSAIAEWTEKCKELHPSYFPEPEEIE